LFHGNADHSQSAGPAVTSIPRLYFVATIRLFTAASFAMSAVQSVAPRRSRKAEREEKMVARKKKMRALTAPVMSAARDARDATWRRGQRGFGASGAKGIWSMTRHSGDGRWHVEGVVSEDVQTSGINAAYVTPRNRIDLLRMAGMSDGRGTDGTSS
jgi:hypothetical protein